MKELSRILPEAVLQLQQCFPDLVHTPPQFFLQFGPGFETDALFDAPPQETFLHNLPGLPDHPTPDNIIPKFHFGFCHSVPVLVSTGHRHHAEGNGLLPCLLPLATAWKCGAKKQIFIDSGISLRPEFKLGRWMLLVDYINGYSFSPTDGCHAFFDDSFPNMTATFSQVQNSELINALDTAGIAPRHGIFMGRPGFHICTAAEAAIARNYGADLLGHDLVLEVMFAHSLGAQVSAMALGTAQWHENQLPKFTRSDMLEICRQCSPDLLKGLAKAIEELSAEPIMRVKLPDSQADEILSSPKIPVHERRSPLRAYLPKYD